MPGRGALPAGAARPRAARARPRAPRARAPARSPARRCRHMRAERTACSRLPGHFYFSGVSTVIAFQRCLTQPQIMHTNTTLHACMRPCCMPSGSCSAESAHLMPSWPPCHAQGRTHAGCQTGKFAATVAKRMHQRRDAPAPGPAWTAGRLPEQAPRPRAGATLAQPPARPPGAPAPPPARRPAAAAPGPAPLSAARALRLAARAPRPVKSHKKCACLHVSSRPSWLHPCM